MHNASYCTSRTRQSTSIDKQNATCARKIDSLLFPLLPCTLVLVPRRFTCSKKKIQKCEDERVGLRGMSAPFRFVPSRPRVSFGEWRCLALIPLFGFGCRRHLAVDRAGPRPRRRTKYAEQRESFHGHGDGGCDDDTLQLARPDLSIFHPKIANSDTVVRGSCHRHLHTFNVALLLARVVISSRTGRSTGQTVTPPVLVSVPVPVSFSSCAAPRVRFRCRVQRFI